MFSNKTRVLAICLAGLYVHLASGQEQTHSQSIATVLELDGLRLERIVRKTSSLGNGKAVDGNLVLQVRRPTFEGIVQSGPDWEDKTFKIGDSLPKSDFVITRIAVTYIKVAGITLEQPEVGLRHVRSGRELTVQLRDLIGSFDKFAILRGADSAFRVEEGEEFIYPANSGTRYKVVEIQPDCLVICRLPDKREFKLSAF